MESISQLCAFPSLLLAEMDHAVPLSSQGVEASSFETHVMTRVERMSRSLHARAWAGRVQTEESP